MRIEPRHVKVVVCFGHWSSTTRNIYIAILTIGEDAHYSEIIAKGIKRIFPMAFEPEGEFDSDSDSDMRTYAIFAIAEMYWTALKKREFNSWARKHAEVTYVEE